MVAERSVNLKRFMVA